MSDAEATIQALRERLAAFVAERQWEAYHDPKNLSMSIAIEAAELMEHFQWLRSEQLEAVLRDPKLHGEIRDEIADVACYLMSLCNVLNIDLSTAVIEKIRKNEQKYPPDKFRGNYHKPR